MANYISIQPNEFFKTQLYTGNAAANAQTLGFEPAFLWIKKYSNSAANYLFDSENTTYSTSSDDSAAPSDQSGQGFTSLDSTGFTLSGTGGGGGVNDSGPNFASWSWRGGTTSGITTNGSTTITPSAYSFSAAAGISILKFSGNSTSGAKLAHGLGVAPQFIMIKNLTDAGESWNIGTEGIDDTSPWEYNLVLSEDAGRVQYVNRWNDTAPDATNITLGNSSAVNGTGKTLMCYCFAPVRGLSHMGRYTGSGSATDSPFLYTGFKPSFIMIKRNNGVGPWMIYDIKRSGYNIINKYLQANAVSAEDYNEANFGLEIYSNGFCPRSTSGATGPNQSGDAYNYLAFASEPLVSSNGNAATAR